MKFIHLVLLSETKRTMAANHNWLMKMFKGEKDLGKMMKKFGGKVPKGVF